MKVQMMVDVERNDLELGKEYFFGIPFDFRVHSGYLIKLNLNDRLEPSAEFCDSDAGGRYVTVPLSLVSDNRKIAQKVWKEIYSKSKRGKYSIEDITN